MKSKKRFGVLKAGTANPDARKRLGDCDEMFISLLSEPGETWDVYDVEHGVFPEDVSGHDGFLITGSRYSVYEDKPWIKGLSRVGPSHVPEIPGNSSWESPRNALGTSPSFSPVPRPETGPVWDWLIT